MDSREEGKELRSAGELDDETIAKKRSRRVSFAETTAVHVFDRDEDFETPPDSKPASTDSPGPAGGVVGFQGDQSDSDDSKGFAHEEREDDEDEDEDGEQERFVRDMDSSSPGSAVGSVTSNDDDNFFGPVSTSFIRSGRLSEAGISDDENHDVTLDSTTFSLHFRNLAPPDDRTTNSAGSIRTPTGDTVPADSGNHMVPARSKKLLSHSKLSDGKLSGSGGGSSNMSLIVNDTHRYDYAKLSPTSEALLSEVNKCMQSNSPNGDSRIMTSDEHIGVVPVAKESEKDEGHVSNVAALDDVPDDQLVGPYLSKDVSMGAVTEQADSEHLSPIMKTDLPVDKSINEKTKGTVSPIAKGFCRDVHEAIQSDTVEATAQNSDMLSPPYRGSRSKFILQSAHVHQALFKDQLSGSQYFSNSSPLSAREVLVPALMITDGQQQEQQLESDCGMRTPKNAVQPFESPSQGSVSSLRAKRQRLFLDSAVCSVGKLTDSSAREQPPSSLELQLVKHSERISAIKNRMSKFTIPETPIFRNPRVATPRKDHLPLEPDGTLERMSNNPSTKLVCLPVMNMEENFTSSVRRNRVQGMSVELNHPWNDIREWTHSEKNEASGETIKPNEAASSSNPETKINQSPLISQCFTEEVSILGEHGSSPRQTMIKLKENSLVSDSVHKVDHQDFCAVQESTSVQDLDLFGKKRRSEQNLIMDEDRASKTSKTEKSPDVSPEVAVSGSGFSLGSQGGCNNEAHDFGGQSPVTHWTNMFAKISEATKLAFSPSMHKLSLQELHILEDMLAELQMARKYERLSASLRNHDRLGDLHHQRVAEVRSLQDKLLYEQAKLQIRRVKLDQLHNKAQLTQSGIRECCNLKLMFSQLSLPSTRASKTKEDHLHSVSSISSSKNQGQHDRVISMRQEVKMLEQKVEHLMKSLGACCKIKGNLNCDEIIKAANEHLEKRKSCRIIHQDLRLWELSNIVKSNDQHDIVLNYCNLLFQRFTVNGSQTSSIAAKISLNDSNIEKTFPNMNACAAFEFVFKAKDDHRLSGSKCLQQKTLETSLLLGTLVDVLEEVQVTRMELLNLTHSTFHSHPSGQLELQLCFMNLRRGWKVTLILDMTNLNCAVYPSEPSELQFKISGTHTTLPLSVSNEIFSALQSLQGGHLMIARFCRLISQAVRAFSG
uniref:Uncharacterized protein LOC105060513 isoform X2 n=1 Tax=Elaeis guineensis var. tenera TaxID=51953 RepID=A0A6I9SGH6_ELAGV|nr:uncharacterized protein LOC105060513 isoform X2 [Elaeis guineensis]